MSPTNIKTTNQLHDQELKLVELVVKLEEVKNNCNRISDTVEQKVAWKGDLDVTRNELENLVRSFEKLNNSHTWLTRIFFTTMLSSLVGLGFFIIQQYIK